MLTKPNSFALRWLGLLVLGTMLATPRVEAQAVGFRVTSSRASLPLGETVTFTINVTNNLLDQSLFNVFVTNTPSARVEVVTVPQPGALDPSGDHYVIPLDVLQPGEINQIILEMRPSFSGPLTNTFTFATTSLVIADITTNIVTQVTNVPLTDVDLAVGISPPLFGAIANDLLTYSVAVSNLGSASVSGVVLSNSLPAGFGFISVNATNQVTQATNAFLLSVGMLTNQAVRNFQFTVWPTNAGDFTLSSSVSAAGTQDTNTADNTASTMITVGTIVTNQLIATNASEMVLNRQTGLMEQSIRVWNASTSAVASAHVIVTGLTNRLYNAAGTNDGRPFVVYASTLETNQSVDLLLEYFVPTRQPIVVPDSAYIAFGAPAPNLTVTDVDTSITNRIVELPSGAMLVEFTSIPGRSYTILYSSNMSFSEALIAQPSIVAQANKTQWIDDGPPKTVSFPGSGMRLYQVRLNP